jgi:hypothetical protein
MTIVKYVGLDAEASALIESRRTRANQLESEIIVEALRPLTAAVAQQAKFDLGQGVKLSAGEPLILFLNEQSKKAERPDGTAEVGANADGIYVESKKVEHSRGSPLAVAMLIFQQRAVADGRAEKVISLNAWRKWHVRRKDRLVSLYELKDPALARRRAPVDVEKLFKELENL